jgi:hypothetical protein
MSESKKMTKLVTYPIVSKAFENDPTIDLLIKNGLFNFDDTRNTVELVSSTHYIIPKDFRKDPLIELLIKHDLFDFEAQRNITYLPLDPHAARVLGISSYSGKPIDSYLDGIKHVFKNIRNAREFHLAQSGDVAAIKLLDEEMRNLQESIFNALAHGKVYIAHPVA